MPSETHGHNILLPSILNALRIMDEINQHDGYKLRGFSAMGEVGMSFMSWVIKWIVRRIHSLREMQERVCV